VVWGLRLRSVLQRIPSSFSALFAMVVARARSWDLVAAPLE
jgi:hypothetical protein